VVLLLQADVLEFVAVHEVVHEYCQKLGFLKFESEVIQNESTCFVVADVFDHLHLAVGLDVQPKNVGNLQQEVQPFFARSLLSQVADGFVNVRHQIQEGQVHMPPVDGAGFDRVDQLLLLELQHSRVVS